MVKNNKKDWKLAILGILAILTYFIFPILEIIPLQILGIDSKQMPTVIKAIYMLSYEMITLLVIMFILKDKINRDWQDMKKNHYQYFKKYFKYWFLILGLMMLSNLFILALDPNSSSGNEDTIRSIFTQMPIYMYLSAVVIAPLLEELIFRLSIRNIIKSTDWLFILISGLVFGSLHVIGNIETWVDLLYIFPYSMPGFIFAYILAKSDNIFVSIGLHFIHNGILMSLQTLVLLFG